MLMVVLLARSTTPSPSAVGGSRLAARSTVGDRPTWLDSASMSSGDREGTGDSIGDERAIDGIGEPSLEGAAYKRGWQWAGRCGVIASVLTLVLYGINAAAGG